MKKLLFSLAAVLLLAASTSSVQAQDLFARRFSLGPIFAAGANTMATEVPEGAKIKPRFCFNVGVLTEVDVSNLVSIDLGLTYETRNRYFYDEDDEDNNITVEASYITLTPMASFKGFLLGFGIRLPMSGNVISDILNSNKDIESSNMKTAIDFKIGGLIPIIKTDGGDLSFSVLGGYDITKPFSDDAFDVFGFAFRDEDKRTFTGADATLQLGLTYQFNVSTMK